MGNLDFLERELEALEGVGRLRTLRRLESPMGGRVKIGGREVVLLCSTD